MHKKARIRLLIPLLIVLVSIMLVGVSFAWFGYQDDAERNITIQTVSLVKTPDFPTENLTHLQEGDVFVNSFSVNKPASATSCYIRARMGFTSSSESLTNAQKDYLIAINSIDYATFVPEGNAYKWVKQGDYFYLTDNSNELIDVTTTDSYQLLGQLTFAGTQGTFLPSTAPANMKFEITMQAIQSQNLPLNDFASVQNYFGATFTDTPADLGYIVRYVANGGSDTIATTIYSAGTITAPSVPSKLGYTFSGWYADAGLTEAFDFSTVINSNIILYANYVAI